MGLAQAYLVQGIEHPSFSHVFAGAKGEGGFPDSGLASNGHAAVALGGVEEGDAFLHFGVAAEEEDGGLVDRVFDGAGGLVQEAACGGGEGGREEE